MGNKRTDIDKTLLNHLYRHRKFFMEIEKSKGSPGPNGLPVDEESESLAPPNLASMSSVVFIPGQVGGAASSCSAGRQISCNRRVS